MRVAGAYWRGDEKQPDAAAHLRHGVGVQEGPRRRTCTGSRRPRSATTASSAPSSTCSRSPRSSAPASRCSTPRAASSAGSWRTTPASATRTAATSSSTRPTSPSRTLFETSRPPRLVRRRHVPARWSWTAGTDYYLKPMNCPFHILIYQSQQRSYRELPLRLFEFGTVYRYEKSGVVHGLTRVRGFTQDDAHIFRTTEQMADELASLLDFVLDLLRDYGLDDFYLELSTKPRGARRSAPTRSGTRPPRRCARSPTAKGLELRHRRGRRRLLRPEDLGAGHATPSAAPGRCRRSSSTSSCPQRFDLEYVGADDERHTADHDPPRPVRLGRAVLRRAASSTTPARSRRGWRRCRCGCCRCATTTTPTPTRLVDRLQGRGLPGRRRSTPTRRSATASARPSARSCPTCSWSATTTSSNGTVGVNPRGGEVERDVAVDDLRRAPARPTSPAHV